MQTQEYKLNFHTSLLSLRENMLHLLESYMQNFYTSMQILHTFAKHTCEANTKALRSSINNYMIKCRVLAYLNTNTITKSDNFLFSV